MHRRGKVEVAVVGLGVDKMDELGTRSCSPLTTCAKIIYHQQSDRFYNEQPCTSTVTYDCGIQGTHNEDASRLRTRR